METLLSGSCATTLEYRYLTILPTHYWGIIVPFLRKYNRAPRVQIQGEIVSFSSKYRAGAKPHTVRVITAFLLAFMRDIDFMLPF